MSQSGARYEYPNGVLRNRLAIQDAYQLASIEAALTGLRVAELDQAGLPGRFDLTHLQAIHHFIFQDVYEWAGEIRTVDIGKGPGQFAHVAFLVPSATKMFEKLAQEQYLHGLPISRFVERAAYYFGEVNALHPFREGNGRAQRMFFFFLAQRCSFFLDWPLITQQEMIDASSASLLRGDNHLIEHLLLRIIAPLQP